MDSSPGPWVVDPLEQRAMSGSRIFKVCSGAPYGGLIADVSAWWVDTETAKANAHLMAAAPDLLAFLEEMVISGLMPEGLEEEAFALILKAKGGAT